MLETPYERIDVQVREHLHQTLFAIETPVPDYRGKVRDVFHRGNELLMVTTDRVSAFDVVLGTIPFKGALLTEQAVFWLNKSRDVIDNHLLERVDEQIMHCQKAEPLRVEMVVRGYLAGSLLREAAATRGWQYGLRIDPTITPYARFAEAIITPTTKADLGKHDSPISPEQIVAQGLASPKQVEQMTQAALALFQMGSVFSQSQGLLLVDTKYEFGLVDGKVILIDEIHSADSSRYWIASSYEECLAQSKAPQMLDKERLRRVLIEQGYDGHDTATLPKLSDDMRTDLACHYWQLTEKLTGQNFCPPTLPSSFRVPLYLSSI